MRWIEGLVRGIVEPLLRYWRDYRARQRRGHRREDATHVRSARDATRRMRKRAHPDEHEDI